ncbi:MAG: SMI1/KNR4 family protein, partial [Planctomycetia bacterium]|nr:SMI1/KNR4 family protein [Planctomycetia bacterium]
RSITPSFPSRHGQRKSGVQKELRQVNHKRQWNYELEAEDMPSWFREGVVFGEIYESGNYFVLHEEHGKERVYYYDHDDFQEEPLAESFEAFLALIVDDPPGFLFRCGCYTRYSDGKTEGQWIPKEYVSNCDAM